MKKRCENPGNLDYDRYGGRGISVCERWRGSFENFFADMGKKPSPKHSLERDDVNGNYTPENCRWATATEQGRNKRDTRFVTYGGERLCAMEAAERAGIHPRLLYGRLGRGWDEAAALTQPVQTTKLTGHVRLYKRGSVYWMQASTPSGRMHKSTRTGDLAAAEQIRDATADEIRSKL
jgi:hypothetical protein